MASAAQEAENDPQAADSVVVRFAGDSGDGMQLTGGQFTLSWRPFLIFQQKFAHRKALCLVYLHFR